MIQIHCNLLTDIYNGIQTNKVEELIQSFNDQYEDLDGGILSLTYNDSRMPDVVTTMNMIYPYLRFFNHNEQFVLAVDEATISGRKQLENLYSLGVRVLSFQKEIGQTDMGLTDEGKKDMKMAVIQGMGIDLSHISKQAFLDSFQFLEELAETGLSPIFCIQQMEDEDYLTLQSLSDKQKKWALQSHFIAGVQPDENFLEHVLLLQEIFKDSSCITVGGNLSKSVYPLSDYSYSLSKELCDSFSDEEIIGIMNENAWQFLCQFQTEEVPEETV